MKILCLNGPNLNRLGKREPAIYGHETLEDVEQKLITYGKQSDIHVQCKQSNHEGELIDWLHNAEDDGINGIIFNPGAYTHTSYAIRDAIASITVPVIEVHISNIHSRESFRHKSVLAPECVGQICGLGTFGYTLALETFLHRRKGES
ncbi:3-dehydroquinate dehydratase, type II [Paenisporosarcina sp. HGH0030]|uniref:type II 3-dehydroquinate dehydratase n=1 Tax=Paenisporosarcina sp. HGH0030 TaxID=1078085 RepID=UPI00034EA9C4|nr:type II 3-dehydroquinate dehydratase [Paenisporosarcina sp. HGH0030]EPD53621.1 3-dehydroquinate dehydratase, type II [Paenisporosarcina sp. HGH0030]